MAEEIKLKPCPKCGHTPDIDDPDFLYPQDRLGTVWSANCALGRCGLSIIGFGKQGAIDGWQEPRFYEKDKV